MKGVVLQMSRHEETATKFDWSGEAIQYTLKKRDRYTEELIRRDFEAAPLNNSMILDAERNIYATGVSNNRFAVVWQMFPTQKTAKVKFAVPTQAVPGESAETLTRQLAAILKHETRGRFDFETRD